MVRMQNKGYGDVEVSEKRFLELSTNPQTGNYDYKSIIEAEGALEGEAQGFYSNVRRLDDNSKVDLDFQAEDINTGKTFFLDHKRMIDFGKLEEQGKDISGFPSPATVAYNMGKKSVKQKDFFLGIEEDGPQERSDVRHIYNFDDIKSVGERLMLMQAVINGAEDARYNYNINDQGMMFLNIDEK